MKKVVNQFTVDVDSAGVKACTVYLSEGDETFRPYDVIVRSLNALTDWCASITVIRLEDYEKFDIDGKGIIPGTGSQIEAYWDIADDDAPLMIKVISWVEDQPNSSPCQCGDLCIEFHDVDEFVGKIWACGKVWNLSVTSHVNSEAGLTEFKLVSEDDGDVVSGERTENNTGGLVIFEDQSRIECKWCIDFDDMIENNNLEVTVSTPVFNR